MLCGLISKSFPEIKDASSISIRNKKTHLKLYNFDKLTKENDYAQHIYFKTNRNEINFTNRKNDKSSKQIDEDMNIEYIKEEIEEKDESNNIKNNLYIKIIKQTKKTYRPKSIRKFKPKITHQFEDEESDKTNNEEKEEIKTEVQPNTSIESESTPSEY